MDVCCGELNPIPVLNFDIDVQVGPSLEAVQYSGSEETVAKKKEMCVFGSWYIL